MYRRNLFPGLLILVLALLLGLMICAGCTTEAPAQTGGILKIANKQDPVMIGNPSTNVYQPHPFYADTCVETLLRNDKSGAPIPWLASSWKQSEDGKTITLTLQKGVKFHDGTDFNAKAVQWNLEKFKGANRPELAKIKSIDIIDDYNLKITLSETDSMFLVNLTHTSGMMISPTSWNNAGTTDKERDAWCEKNPIGTGPFKFTSWQRTVKITYQKFENYWQKGKPYLDGVEWDIIADNLVQTAALKAGEIQMISAIEPQVAKDLGTQKDFIVSVPTGSSRIYMLMGDSVHPESPFSNIKVRQAVQYAVDTKAICNSIGYGYWEPTNQYASVGTWGYNPDVTGYPYNPQKAKQLLTEAGYPNGFKTTLTAMTGTTNQDLMTAVAGYLSGIGIEAKIDMVTQAAQQPMLSKNGWTNGMQFSPLGCEPNELSGMTRYFSKEMHSSRVASLFLPDEYMDLIAKASVAPNFDAMKSIVQQIQKVGTDKYCIAMYLNSMKTMAAKTNKLRDDNLSIINGLRWTPETALLSK
jgi:peptide/nickel transport system substrate-binding protein